MTFDPWSATFATSVSEAGPLLPCAFSPYDGGIRAVATDDQGECMSTGGARVFPAGPRVPEKETVIEDLGHAEAYGRMQTALRDRGWLETRDLLEDGLTRGPALEVGSGPGLLGLEWLEHTDGTQLLGLDRSRPMAVMAQGHAHELGLRKRATFLVGLAEDLPLRDGAVASVFSSRSLHEWLDPGVTICELRRVLKPGGRLFLSDLRRDLSPSARRFLEKRMTCDVVLAGLRASLDAAYTVAEVRNLLQDNGLDWCRVEETPLGLRVSGEAPPAP